ncbi:MAG: HAD hydrolase-like protein, partial [candidate division Zixibacteria bacterium]|nr:HAD hydrolase-like protein [candidate division Zixibacteria bacterium]
MTERPALVFDLDGTLIDSSEGVVAAFNYSLAAMGQPEQPAEMIKKYIGYPLSDVYPRFTSAPLSELYHHFQIKARETVVSSTVALGGVTAALRHLHRDGWLMAIATTKIRAHVDGIIDKLGWSGYFAALVGGDEVEH